MHKVQTIACSVAAAAAAAALAAVPAPSAWAQDLTELNILTSNHESCGLYGQFIATEVGINEDFGIKTNLINSDTTVPYVAFLSSGDADVVMLDTPQVLQMEDKEPDLGRVVYEVMQFAPEGIFVPADSEIMGLKDVHDITVGLASDRDQITTIIALDSIGQSIESANIETVVTGDSGPVFAKALNDGSIQAFAGSSADSAYLESVGYEFRNITPTAVSQNPGNSFVVGEARMEEMNDPYQAFFKGWAMGTHAAAVDIKAVAEICRTVLPEQFENLEAGMNALEYQVTVLQLRRTVKYGEPQVDVWAQVQAPYIKLGEVSKQLDPKDFTDRRFIDEANDFTAIEVKEYIAAWRKAHPDALLP